MAWPSTPSIGSGNSIQEAIETPFLNGNMNMKNKERPNYKWS